MAKCRGKVERAAWGSGSAGQCSPLSAAERAPPTPHTPLRCTTQPQASEGIDFADTQARGVVLIGIPFPNVKDTKVRAVVCVRCVLCVWECVHCVWGWGWVGGCVAVRLCVQLCVVWLCQGHEDGCCREVCAGANCCTGGTQPHEGSDMWIKGGRDVGVWCGKVVRWGVWGGWACVHACAHVQLPMHCMRAPVRVKWYSYRNLFSWP